MSDTAQIHFHVPRKLYEEFFKLFPGHGMRTLFFTKLMQKAVENGKGISSLIDEIWDEASGE
ncbi:MAG: hypothetical protein WC479_07265 [Candidatus Izemoplasmatales bacterium]